MKPLLIICTLATLFLATGCNTWPGYGQTRMTSVNVHCRLQKERSHGRVVGAYLLASYLGYVQKDEYHKVIPVNTEVQAYPWDQGFILKVPKLNREIRFQYNPVHMHMPVTDYISMITSTGKVDLSAFSAVDQKGIAEGEIYPGMTRNGVRLAWGEPARHATPLLDMPKWVYWRTRFKRTVVSFDKNGRVANVK